MEINRNAFLRRWWLHVLLLAGVAAVTIIRGEILQVHAQAAETATPVMTESATMTDASTEIPNATETTNPSETPLPPATETMTSTPVEIPFATETPSPTASPTLTASATASPSATPQPSFSPTPAGVVVPFIVGGSQASKGEYPWQVALISSSPTNLYYGQFCGGSLVTNQWVVTAAHCVYGESASNINVVAGVYNLYTPTSGYQRRAVVQIIIHPKYNSSTSDYDIALIKLKTTVNLGGSGEIKTAAIPLVPSNVGALAGVQSWVTGWGDTQNNSEPSNILREVNIPIVTNSLCNDSNHYGGGITTNMMCAGLEAGGKDSCQGDSGGPLIVNHGGAWKLAGVVSWGNGCAEPKYFGVYTRVSNFTNWVNSYILPGNFKKSAPGTGSTNIALNPILKWTASSGSTNYQYCYDTTNDNACSNWQSAGNVLQKQISGLKTNTRYYWQVRAVNAAGVRLADGGTFWYFTTKK